MPLRAYQELHNIDGYVQSQLYKLASSGLCSNIPGQIMMSLMVTPPKPVDLSYERFAKEESEIFDGLKRRAKVLVDGLNKVNGIRCNAAEGAMYAFPSVEMPQAAIAAAEAQHMSPDTLYALSLLDHSGICVVPASGFGQKEGRYGCKLLCARARAHVCGFCSFRFLNESNPLPPVSDAMTVRTTFLPPDDKMMKAVDQFAAHHKYFCEKFSD